MATIRKFKYNGKPREVIVLENNNGSLKGIDISYADDKEKTEWKKLAENLNPQLWLDEKTKDTDEGKNELAKVKSMMKCFRHFKESGIQEIDEPKDE